MTTHAIPAMHLNRHRRYVYGLVLRSNVRFCYSNGLTQLICMKSEQTLIQKYNSKIKM